MARKQGQPPARQEALTEESLALFEADGNTAGIAETVSALGVLACDQGDLARGRVLLEESLTHYRVLRASLNLANTVHSLGWVWWIQGDAALVVRLCYHRRQWCAV